MNWNANVPIKNKSKRKGCRMATFSFGSSIHKLNLRCITRFRLWSFSRITKADTKQQIIVFRESHLLKILVSFRIGFHETSRTTQATRTNTHRPSRKDHIFSHLATIYRRISECCIISNKCYRRRISEHILKVRIFCFLRIILHI